MKKYIYIIKNDINEKVYIGQAKDVKQRFLSHCKPSAGTLNNDLVGRAIQKYGKEHFVCEILCDATENYNELERLYIEKYNSLAPNGYNICIGGEEPPVMKGSEHPGSILSEEQIESLTRDLRETDLSFVILAKKYGYSSNGMISAFNNGSTYHRGNIKYPIRDDVYNGKLSCQDVLEIINRLKTSYDSYETIAKDYDVDYRTIAKINKGTSHYQSNEEYPIRESKPCGATPKFTFDQITQITNLLLDTKISLREIGRMFNASYDDIVNIKNGKLKMYRRKGLTYPLRKNN